MSRFNIGEYTTASGIVLDAWENKDGGEAVVLAVGNECLPRGVGRPKRSKPSKFNEYLSAGLTYDELCKVFSASKTTICRWAKKKEDSEI